MQLCKSPFSAGWGRACGLLACLLWAGFGISGRAQTSLNVTNYGAAGDAVRFSVNTTSNSTLVTVTGTNRFSSTDIGKVIEVFRAGKQTYWSNNPAYGVFSTNQDTICLITNVTQGTNLWGTISEGWKTNTYCIVGRNNSTNFQNCINAAQSLVGTGKTNVTINIPAGTYLCIGSNILNPNFVLTDINGSPNTPTMTITSGGITFLGASSTNTVLMGCGAGMEHYLLNGGNPNNTWPYGNSGASTPTRGSLFTCLGPIANSQYPLVFQNLTFDGGVTNGWQSYSYFILQQGDGSGWDTSHHALVDLNPNGTPGDPKSQMNQLKVFTNCVFQHWRGEILICTTGIGGTNTFNDIENCTFYDGNATADNLYFGQHVKNCIFNHTSKVEEFYQNNSTLPNTFEYNLCTNIVGNNYYFTVVGATTNQTQPNISINNNTWYGSSAGFIQFSPAVNVSVVSNSFNGAPAIVFTSAGVQPSDGSTVPTMTNFQFLCNSGLTVYMDGYGVSGVLISNNVSCNQIAPSAGYKNNIVLADNSFNANGGFNISGSGITSGSYMIDMTNNSYVYANSSYDSGDYYQTNYISYGNGYQHLLRNSAATFYLDDSSPSLIPPNAVITEKVNTWTGLNVTNFYMSKTSPGSPITMTNNTTITFYWNSLTGRWQTNSTIIPPLAPPTNLR